MPRLWWPPFSHSTLALGVLLFVGCRAGPAPTPGRPTYPADSGLQPAPASGLTRSIRSTRTGPAYELPATLGGRRIRVAWRPALAPSNRLLTDRNLLSLEAEVSRWVADERLLLYPPSPPRAWQYIILHHSASKQDSLETIDRYHREVRGWDGCGYHFVIGNGTLSGDGEIEVSQRWLEQKHGAHTKVAGYPEYNQYGIGICLVGDFEETRPTELQVRAARALVAYLAAHYSIPLDHITTHGKLAHGRTRCPGRYFPEDFILRP